MFRLPRSPLRWSGVLLPAALAVAVLAVGLNAALAQDDVGDLRDQREENRRDAADIAARIDALGAEDAELVEALAAIDAHIALQEFKVDTALAAIEAAEAQAAEARRRAELVGLDIEAVRDRLRERAVEAFMGPANDGLALIDTADLNAAAIRESFLNHVVGDEYELVDQLRVKVAEQDEAERLAAALVAEAQVERAQLELRLAELAAARGEASELRAEIEQRIAEWEITGDDLAAVDEVITAQIRSLEVEAARRAAEAEARRVAEAARIAAEEAAAAEAAAAAESAADDPPAEEDSGTVDAPVDAAVGPVVGDSVAGDFAITHRPVPGSIVSPFGERVHPIFGALRTHFGVDFNSRQGDPIAAAAAGTVLSAGWMNGYGNTVVISHGAGFATVYAHQTDLAVAAGDVLAGGELVGWVGSTGWSTGPHLHFEVRIEGIAVDPAPYLP